jgi:hypothetical protein
MTLLISLIASLVALTMFVAELHGRQLHTLPRAVRAGLALVFVGIAVVTGKVWYETQRTHTVTTSLQEPDTTSQHSVAAIGTVREPAANSIETTTRTMAKPQSHGRNVRPTTGHDEITVGEDSTLPDVAGAANDALSVLRSPLYRVQGRLRSTQSQPDAGLQGLITTDLTLDVTLIGTQGTIHDAFTVTSRGGGFTSDASALQARQRLRQALEDRRPKEHS